MFYLNAIQEEEELVFPKPEEVVQLCIQQTQLLKFEGLKPLINLQVLHLEQSIFSELPSVVRLLTKLSELYLAYCRKPLSVDLGPLNLRVLDISECQLTQLPNLQSQTRLCELYLDRNKLTSIPSWIGTLPLQILDLSWNNLTVLPEELLFLANLTHLNLEWNNLKLVRLARLSSLKTLLLSGNPIKKLLLPKNLEQLYIDRPVCARLQSSIEVHFDGNQAITFETLSKKVNQSFFYVDNR